MMHCQDVVSTPLLPDCPPRCRAVNTVSFVLCQAGEDQTNGKSDHGTTKKEQMSCKLGGLSRHHEKRAMPAY